MNIINTLELVIIKHSFTFANSSTKHIWYYYFICVNTTMKASQTNGKQQNYSYIFLTTHANKIARLL